MKISGTLFLICIAFLAFSQKPATYSRVKIHLDGHPVSTLASTGIDLEHGQHATGKFFITELGDWEIGAVRDAGFNVEIQIPDVQEHYRQQLTGNRGDLECVLDRYSYDVPEYFSLGTMGGYHTLDEMKNMLDDMSITFPHLINVKQQIGPLTHEGNNVFWIKISDNPDFDEDEPDVLYTALHHAREPLSLSQMLYFMWYLLENYGTDPEVTFLVDNTELFFVPCVNPDGYEYNAITHPQGGGMWRKNMRDNDGNGIFNEQEDGVDINRNYGYQWAHDNNGSSPAEGSSVYRGPDPFSEPETRAIKMLIDEHNFQFIINYHSYGNFLLFPWGYVDANNPQEWEYEAYAEALTIENKYPTGNSYQTVGYVANGTAGDWQYSEGSAWAFTPEVGSDDEGFWPATERIIPLCKSAMHQNLALAHLPHNFAMISETSDRYIDQFHDNLDIHLKRYGTGSGSFLLEVNALSPEIDLNFDPELIALSMFESVDIEIPFTIDQSVIPGDTVFLEIRLNNGKWTREMLISKIIAEKDVVLSDQGLTLEAWEQTGSAWGVTLEEAYSEPASLADSPEGDYAENAFNVLALKETIDLTDVTHAELRYKAKWEIEDLIDYAAVQVSVDGENYISLCGNHTTSGSIFQLYKESLYDGVQEEWISETISLDAYLGTELDLRFILVSDGFFNMDGIYLDDIEIILYDQETTTTHVIEPGDFRISSYPNPASDIITFKVENEFLNNRKGQLTISNSLGQKVKSIEVTGGVRHSLDVSNFSPGWYSAMLVSGGQFAGIYRFLVQ